MIIVGITTDALCKGEVETYGVSTLIVKANSVLCVQCGKWIRGRCIGEKRLTPRLPQKIICCKCEGNIERLMNSKKCYVMMWRQ